jgi:hypothetical protein
MAAVALEDGHTHITPPVDAFSSPFAAAVAHSSYYVAVESLASAVHGPQP